MSNEEKIANNIRDVMNWLSVFENQYELPQEVVETLKTKLENIIEQLKPAVESTVDESDAFELFTDLDSENEDEDVNNLRLDIFIKDSDDYGQGKR